MSTDIAKFLKLRDRFNIENATSKDPTNTKFESPMG